MPKPVRPINYVDRRVGHLPLQPGKPWVFPKTFITYSGNIESLPISDRYYIRDITASHYTTVAREVNRTIDEYNKWADQFNKDLEKISVIEHPTPKFKITFPNNPTLTEPYGWLQKALGEVDENVRNALDDVSRYWNEFYRETKEEDRRNREKREQYQREQEAKIQNARFEDIKTTTLSSFKTLSTQINELSKKFNQLDFDVRKNQRDKDSAFSLFRSELISQIPNDDMNVSRLEYDEGIAQLNETLNGIKNTMDKKAKQTEDSITKLQKKVNVSMMDISKRANSSIMGIEKRVSENEKKNRLFLIENEKNLLKLDYKFEKALGETLAQSDEISNLRKDLQALGGETREFIDNTKRQEQAMKAKVAKKESVVTRIVKKAAFPDLTKRPWLKESVTGRFFQLVNQW